MAHDELDVNRVLFRYGARHDRNRNRILLSIPQVAADISVSKHKSYFDIRVARIMNINTITISVYLSILLRLHA